MSIRAVVRSAVIPVSIVLLSTVCERPPAAELVGVEASPLMSRLGTADELPFRMSGLATLTSQRFAPGFPGQSSDFDGRCSIPSHFVIAFSMTAEAAHLGRITAEFEHCSRIDFTTGASTLADGVAVLTAANGDELWAAYRSADEPEGEFDEHLTFHGGTGRFETAGGQALAMAECDRATGTCDFEARGTLVYDASRRAAR